MQELCSLGTCVVRAHDGEPDTLGHTLGRGASDPLCEVTLEQTFQGSRLRCPGHLGYISGKGEGSSPHPHPTTDSSGREDRHILAAIKNLLVSHLSPSRKGFLSLGLTIRRRTEGPQAAPPWVSLCLRPVCRRQLPGLSLLLRPEKLYSRPTCSAEPASFGARLHLLRRPVGGALLLRNHLSGAKVSPPEQVVCPEISCNDRHALPERSSNKYEFLQFVTFPRILWHWSSWGSGTHLDSLLNWSLT